jgi:glycosyltransferase involved in cell wall biosynthesis
MSARLCDDPRRMLHATTHTSPRSLLPHPTAAATSSFAGLRVALVHDWLLGMRGGEKCLEPLCRHFPDAPLYTLFAQPGTTSPTIESRAIHASSFNRLPGVRHYYRWLLPLMPRAAKQWRLSSDLDLVLSFSHSIAKAVPVPAGVPHVCYCFTPMRYAWDLRQQYFGKRPDSLWNHPLERARDRALDALSAWDRQTSAGVTHFVACSRTIQQRIARIYQRDSQVIYPPVDTQFYQPDRAPREDYYLCVSALVPYKRLELAIDACRRLRRRLVMIGSGPEAKRLARRASQQVEFLGWRSNEEIRWHLQRCRALLFPGHEDFGMVPVEAQACGAPVIAYGRGGATETIVPADGAQAGSGLFFQEQTSDALADAIDRFERTPDAFDAHVARSSAERFSAARYLREMLSLIADVTRVQAV